LVQEWRARRDSNP